MKQSQNKKPQPDPAPEVNQALRQWTRGVSFTLSMGKTQVAALVAISLAGQTHPGMWHPLLNNWVGAVRALVLRGLVLHSPNHYRADETWKLTEAGALVLALLKITGVYQEMAAELSRPEAQRPGFQTFYGRAK